MHGQSKLNQEHRTIETLLPRKDEELKRQENKKTRNHERNYKQRDNSSLDKYKVQSPSPKNPQTLTEVHKSSNKVSREVDA